MELNDTIEMMNSADYKERFKAEYHQTKIRYEKLHKMLAKADAGTLDFTPTCPLDFLREQKANMGKYLYCLEVRAEMEGINLGVGKKLTYARLADDRFVKKEETDRGYCEGYFVRIDHEATEADIAEAKKEVVENVCRLIRQIANGREDFFIIKEGMFGDGSTTVAAKFILPTVKEISI